MTTWCLVQLGMPEIFKAKKSENVVDDVEKILGSCPRSQWGSLVAIPEWSKFESQQEDEKIVILGRKHIIRNLGWITVVSFSLFIPMFWKEFPFIKMLDGNALIGMTMLWYMVLAFYGLQNFLMWFYNVYIVTNERIIDVDFVGLLSKNVNVCQLNKIEDVNYSQRGMLASFFNYGDVIVETASKQNVPNARDESSAFTFESIAYPDKVVAVISQLIEEHDDQNNQE